MSKKAKIEFEIILLETVFKNRLLTLADNNNLGIVDPKIIPEQIG